MYKNKRMLLIVAAGLLASTSGVMGSTLSNLASSLATNFKAPTFYASDVGVTNGFSGITSLYIKDSSGNLYGITDGWSQVQALSSGSTVTAYLAYNTSGLSLYQGTTVTLPNSTRSNAFTKRIADFGAPSGFGGAGGYYTVWINNIMMPQIIFTNGGNSYQFKLNSGTRPA